MIVYILVEGSLDATVARRIVNHCGGSVGTVYGRKGLPYIEERIDDFNQSAQGIPILALVDLMDTGFDCPVDVVEHWLPHREADMLLRVVVREIESWILADRTGIARYFGIREPLVSHHPERLDDPKKALVDLARSSQYQSLRNDIVPEDPTVNAQGPAYISRMQSFVRERWNIGPAKQRSASLRRCMEAVRRLIDRS
jgi:hypothetical protein